MRNRSKNALPVVLANDASVSMEQIEKGLKPVKLMVYDVTYLHFHKNIALGYCVSGEGICYVEDKAYPFSAGDVQIIFPYQKHLSKNTTAIPSTWYWANIDISEVLSQSSFTAPEKLKIWMQCEMGLCGIIDKSKYKSICQNVKKIFHILHAEEGTLLHPQELMASALLELILHLCEASRQLPKLSLHTKNFAEDLKPALTYINEEIQNGNIPKVVKLPTLCNMSPANFRRVFSKTMGFSPKEYISHCCIHKAKKLLAYSNMPVSQISAEIGYENISSFNRRFLHLTQMSPTQFRQMTKK